MVFVAGIVAAAAAATAAIAGSVASTVKAKRDAENAAGATTDQRALLGISRENISRMQAQQGLSARQVQNIQQIGQGQARQAQSTVSSVQASTLSPLERQRFGERIFEMQRAEAQATENKIGLLDIGEDIRRQDAVVRAAGTASQQAEAVRSADAEKARLKREFAAQGFKTATTILSATSSTTASFAPTKSKDVVTPAQAPQGATPTLAESTPALFAPEATTTGTPSLRTLGQTDPILAKVLSPNPAIAARAESDIFGVPTNTFLDESDFNDFDDDLNFDDLLGDF